MPKDNGKKWVKIEKNGFFFSLVRVIYSFDGCHYDVMHTNRKLMNKIEEANGKCV